MSYTNRHWAPVRCTSRHDDGINQLSLGHKFMTKVQPQTKYFAYLRKSSEGEERQALSIPSQKDKTIEFFDCLDIEFVVEKHSAFLPDNRPAFADMIARMKRGVPSNSPKYTCYKCRNKIVVEDLEDVFQHQLKNFFLSPSEVNIYLNSADDVIRGKEPFACKLGQCVGQGVLTIKLYVTICSHQQHPGARELSGDELEQHKAWRVRPVQVVQHHHDGLLLAGRREEGRNAVKEPESRLLRTIHLRRRLKVRQFRFYIGNNFGDVCRAGAHLASKLLGVGISHVGTHSMHLGPIGRHPLLLVAAAPH